MEKLEVGEYVRTKDGIIAKITDILNEYSIDCDNDVFDIENGAMMEIPWEYIQEYIVKHSKNIIDLIELYDYVNGMIVFDIINYDNGEKELKLSSGYLMSEDEIQDILTHEQYEQNCYKLN